MQSGASVRATNIRSGISPRYTSGRSFCTKPSSPESSPLRRRGGPCDQHFQRRVVRALRRAGTASAHGARRARGLNRRWLLRVTTNGFTVSVDLWAVSSGASPTCEPPSICLRLRTDEPSTRASAIGCLALVLFPVYSVQPQTFEGNTARRGALMPRSRKFRVPCRGALQRVPAAYRSFAGGAFCCPTSKLSKGMS